jgi:hypothetical protein
MMFKKKPATVDGIMSTFTSTIKDLEALSLDKAIEAEDLKMDAAELREEAGRIDVDAGDALAEGGRASTLAQKLSGLFTLPVMSEEAA